MCPCLSSRSKYAICCKSSSGQPSPSKTDKEMLCLGVYELCSVFMGDFKTADEDGSYGGYMIEREMKEVFTVC